MQGIYEINNTRNNKRYIGSSNNIQRRKQEHEAALVAGEHNNYALQRDFTYYGCEVFRFKILEIVEDKKKLKKREYHYLHKYTLSELYNQTLNPWFVPSGQCWEVTETKQWGYKA